MTAAQDLASEVAELKRQVAILTRSSQMGFSTVETAGGTVGVGAAVAATVDTAAALPILADQAQTAQDTAESTASVIDGLDDDLAARFDEASADLDDARASLDAAQQQLDDAFISIGDLDTATDEAKQAARDATAAASAAATTATDASQAASTAQTAADAARSAAATANQAALDASGLAASKGEVIVQVSAPTGSRANPANLWIDISGTPAKNTPNRYNPSTSKWEPVSDQKALDAAAAASAASTAAQTAQSTADAAKASAATAQTAASNAQSSADQAQQTAGTAASNAQAAIVSASAAQGTADTAKSNAATAKTAADNAASAAASAAGIANGKADTLIQSAAPASAYQKSTTLWIDTTGNANTPKRWSGSAWVAVTDKAATDAAAAAATAQSAAQSAASAASVAQLTADTAKSNAAAAQSTADAAKANAAAAQSAADAANTQALAAAGIANGKGKLIVQVSAPTGSNAAAENLWFDISTDANGKPKNQPNRWNASTSKWEPITDQKVVDAATAAATAQSTASSAATAASTAQTAADAAKTAAQNAQTTANNAGQAASAAQSTADTAKANAATAQTAANQAASAASTAQSTADQANSAAASAAGIANGKGKVLYSTTAPTGSDAATSNLWIDTSGSPAKNAPNRWSGTAWVTITDKTATDAASAAATANTAAGTAKAAADAAQSTANTAKTNAATAQTAADAAKSAAATAQSTADTAKANAATAQTAANAAQSTADTAKSNAATAQTSADNANSQALSAAGIANGKGRVIYQASAPTGTNASANNLWIRTSDNVPFTYDATNAKWVQVTDATATNAASAAATANTAAGTAKTAADNAASAASAAQQTANAAQSAAAAAQTTANGRPQILFGTGTPVGTAPQGSTWFQVDSSGNVIGQWQQTAASSTGSTWTARQMTSAIMAGLDVAKLTAGTAALVDAVIQKIAAQTANIQTANIANLFVTSGATLSSAVIEALYAQVVKAHKITADMIDVGTLSGVTLIGTIIKTAASGARLELLGTRLDVYGDGASVAGSIYAQTAGTYSQLFLSATTPGGTGLLSIGGPSAIVAADNNWSGTCTVNTFLTHGLAAPQLLTQKVFAGGASDPRSLMIDASNSADVRFIADRFSIRPNVYPEPNPIDVIATDANGKVIVQADEFRTLDGTSVSYDTDWVTTGFTVSSGITINGARIRRVGQVVSIILDQVIVDSIAIPTTGDVANRVLVKVPAGFAPTVIQSISSASGGAMAAFYINSAGNVTLAATVPDATQTGTVTKTSWATSASGTYLVG